MKRAKPLVFGLKLSLAAAAAGAPRRFSIAAYNGGTLPVNGFELPVIVDLQGLRIPPDGVIPLLIDHEISTEATLGQTDSIVNDGESLAISGPVTGISHRAQNVLAMFDGGHSWQASIGLLVTQQEMIAAGQSVAVNGQTFVGPVIVARESVLRETSVLPMGADATTSVNLAAAAAQLKGAAMTFEEWLASLGVDPATLDDTKRAALMLAYEAAQNPASPTPAPAAARGGKTVKAEGATFEEWLASQGVDPATLTPEELATYQQMYQDLQTAAPPPAAAPAAASAALNLQAQLRRTAAAEMRRQAEINAKTIGHPLIAAAAIEQGWSVEKAELAVLKAQAKQRAPFGHVKSPDHSPAVLEAALCLARKLPNVEKQYSDQVLQAAHTQFRGGIRLSQIILRAAAQNGYGVGVGDKITNSNYSDVIGYASRTLQAAGPSVLSVPGILSNVANKEVAAGYEQGDNTWREIAAIKSVSDFKEVTTYRLLDNMKYEKLGKGGIIKQGAVSEESYTRKANTYAKMFSLDRQDIINDDLGVFDDLRKRIGLGASIALNEVFWVTFMGQLGTMFTTARTNYISGATSNLGTDGVGLGLGVTAFRKMTSPSTDGSKRVNADRRTGAGGRPEILLVPPELEHNADKLYVGANLNTGTAAGEENIFRGKYRPVVAWQLSDSGYTGYSLTQWFLLNNPAYLAAMVVSFLDGVETPVVEVSDADFNQLGIQIRGYHDFGCDDAEYLAGVMSKGAN